MVIVRLSGGLGNQMFQYAAGRCLAEKRKDELFLETSRLNGRPNATSRTYQLDIFNIRAEIADFHLLKKRTKLLLGFIQCSRGYHPDILQTNSHLDVFLEGNWVSERYFKDIEWILRSDFTFKSTKWDRESSALSERIRSTPAICLHVRRGDYVTPLGDFMGFVGTEYYARAISLIASKISNAHFYIFSDDMQWCMENFSLRHPHTFVCHRDSSADYTEIDLHLMTLCRHFIIANSTFSWWAAWLGSCDSKLIVAPRRWFRADEEGAVHIIPEGWKLL